MKLNLKHTPFVNTARALLGLMLLSSLSACSDGTTKMHGHIEKLEYQGQTCWIFVDDNHRSYEVITPSELVLRENLQMSIKAVEVERKTLCQLPTVIDILAFRPDYEKDM